MEQIQNYFGQHWRELLPPLVVFILVLVVGWFVQRLVFAALRRWSSKTSGKLDDLIISALSGPMMLWVLILALYISTNTLPISARAMEFSSRILLVLWIISFTIVGARLLASLIAAYGSSVTGGALPVTSITQNLASLTVGIVGLLILLNTLGISIAPILTALGVGGLAVALALQDTLANFFAGFYISIAGQVRTADYVKLESGEEGYVTDISWRATTIRALGNNLIIVPNSKLAQAIVTNYHLPEKRMSLLIPISVSYDSDPNHIERVLVEEAKSGANDIPGLLAQPEPFVRFIPGFGDSSLNFTLICQVREFVDQYFAQHELRKRIFARFRREGIEIPFPIRTLQFKNAINVASLEQGAAPRAAVPGRAHGNND